MHMRTLSLAVGLTLLSSAAFATGTTNNHSNNTMTTPVHSNNSMGAITNNNTAGIQFNGSTINNAGGTMTNSVNNSKTYTTKTNSDNKTTVNSNNTTKSNNTNAFNTTSHTHNTDKSVHNTANGGTATSSATGGNASATGGAGGNATSNASNGNQTLTGGNTTTGSQTVNVEASKRPAIAPNLGNLSNGPCSGVSGGVSLGLPGLGIGGQVGSVDGQCTLRYNIEVVARFNPELAAEMTNDLEGVRDAKRRIVERQIAVQPSDHPVAQVSTSYEVSARPTVYPAHTR